MTFVRRGFLAALLAFGMALALPVSAQVKGRDYTLLATPQPTDDPRKIEVIEFFSYACGHCNEFHPYFDAWVARQQADVVVKRVPVSFGGYFTAVAPLYYTLDAMGSLARLDGAVYNSIHAEGNRLADSRSRAAWAASNGLDATKFEEVYRSFSVSSKVRRADQMTQAYDIRGVPALVIDGRYLIASLPHEQQLAVADKLIASLRKEKAGKK